MISQKQLEANRRNALKSTGPRTPQGKAAVRLNALKHGLHAQELVISPEEQAEYDRNLDAFLEDLDPDVPAGTALVRQIAETSWRIALLRAYETQLLNDYLRKLKPSLKKKYRNLTPRQRLAAAFQANAAGPRSLDRLSLQATQLERAFYRALHEFQSLQTPPSGVAMEFRDNKPIPDQRTPRKLLI